MKRRPKYKLPYLDARRDRNGQTRYWYFRRNKQFWKLPGETFADFAAEYQRLVEYTDGLDNSTAGNGPSATRNVPLEEVDLCTEGLGHDREASRMARSDLCCRHGFMSFWLRVGARYSEGRHRPANWALDLDQCYRPLA
jgi:hypothetical protein